MFAKNSIAVEPHATTKLLLSSQDQKFVLRLILPAVWEIRSENHRKNGESLHPSDDVTCHLRDNFVLLVRIIRPSKNSCGSDSY